MILNCTTHSRIDGKSAKWSSGKDGSLPFSNNFRTSLKPCWYAITWGYVRGSWNSTVPVKCSLGELTILLILRSFAWLTHQATYLCFPSPSAPLEIVTEDARRKCTIEFMSPRLFPKRGVLSPEITRTSPSKP